MENKLAIIDPVGIKSGMNHYDIFLCQSLVRLNCKPFIYSNFEAPSPSIVSKSFFGIFFKNKFSQTLNFIWGMIRSCIDCKKNHIDTVLIHVFSTHNMAIMTYAFCKLFGLKTISISHDVFSFTKQDNNWYHHLIYNRWSDRIVVHNSYSKEHLLPQINAKMHPLVSVLKHGSFIDLPDKTVSRKSARKALQLDNSRKYILFFGRLKTTKRLDLLLKAMPEIDSSIHLIIAGHSGKDDFAYYQKMIDEFDLSHRIVQDINYISEEKREFYFKAVDSLVLPYELIFQSGVLLMALSYGLPVVATKIPPFEEVINDGENALLFEKGNVQDLALKINTLMGDDDLLNAIPEKAIEHMKANFSWDDIAEGYVPLLNELNR